MKKKKATQRQAAGYFKSVGVEGSSWSWLIAGLNVLLSLPSEVFLWIFVDCFFRGTVLSILSD